MISSIDRIGIVSVLGGGHKDMLKKLKKTVDCLGDAKKYSGFRGDIRIHCITWFLAETPSCFVKKKLKK